MIRAWLRRCPLILRGDGHIVTAGEIYDTYQATKKQFEKMSAEEQFDADANAAFDLQTVVDTHIEPGMKRLLEELWETFYELGDRDRHEHLNKKKKK